MKKLIFPFSLLLLSSAVLADEMMGPGMMGYSGTGGWMFGSLLGMFYFALVSFVFSIIFWLTYKWLIKDKKR